MTTYPSIAPSIWALLESNADRFQTRPAIRGEEGTPLSHQDILRQVTETVDTLRHLGIKQTDRVALVLPGGADLAVAFLAVAAGAVAAPLNPAYLQEAFQFHLQDLSAGALILPQGIDSPARIAATNLGIPILELVSSKDLPGKFTLTGSMPVGKIHVVRPSPEDIALVLHTSGTTSRPKRVPLSHANLCASASNIASHLRLQPEDISLSVMPLFHIHGLACLLAGLSAGGSVVCVRSILADQFPVWLEKWKPTWMSAVPTMLQALLDSSDKMPLSTHSLRFIRTSSSALSPLMMANLEKVFGVPVIESYGMTEAAHQMASNVLPPGTRKAGSVGLPSGPEIAILDVSGTPVKNGVIGEVSIKGENVTRGYENNPEANAAAFCDGWLRTGDQGYFDEQGYLFISGRLKEIINRGGEKITPREIDETLLAHPSIQQAIVFAVPHPSLGEDLAAAVVLHPGSSAQEAELRVFLLDRLPAFKVPSRIVFLDQIPKGATGKVQRIGMAERLAKVLNIAYTAPVTDMEKRIADVIGAVLSRERVGRNDNFFALGGDSLRATQVLTRLGQALDLHLPVPLLFRLPTPALLASRLEELVASREIDELAAALSHLSPEEQAQLLEKPISES